MFNFFSPPKARIGSAAAVLTLGAIALGRLAVFDAPFQKRFFFTDVISTEKSLQVGSCIMHGDGSKAVCWWCSRTVMVGGLRAGLSGWFGGFGASRG